MLFIDFIGFIIEYFRAAVPAAIILKCRNAIVTSLVRPRLRSLWWTLICEAEGVQRSTVFTNLWNRVQDGTQKTIKLLDFGTITSRFKLLQIVSLTEVSLSMESFLSNGEDRTGFLFLMQTWDCFSLIRVLRRFFNLNLSPDSFECFPD